MKPTYKLIEKVEPRFLKIGGVADVNHPKNTNGEIGCVYEVLNKRPATCVLLFNYDYTKIYLVKQFRAGALKEIWEIPAGIHEAELSAEENMIKEIYEECGYNKQNIDYIEILAEGYISPGYTTEYMTIFTARLTKDAVPDIETRFDENECLTGRGLFTIDEAEKMGAFLDIKSAYAYYLFVHKYRKEKMKT